MPGRRAWTSTRRPQGAKRFAKLVPSSRQHSKMAKAFWKNIQRNKIIFIEESLDFFLSYSVNIVLFLGLKCLLQKRFILVTFCWEQVLRFLVFPAERRARSRLLPGTRRSIYIYIYNLSTSIYLSIYLCSIYIDLSIIYLSIYIYIYLSIYLSIYLYIYLSIYLSICVFIYLLWIDIYAACA